MKLDMDLLRSKVVDVEEFLREFPVPDVETIAHLLSMQGVLLQRESMQLISDASHLEGNRSIMRLEAAGKLAACATSSYTSAGALMLALEKARIKAEVENEKVAASVKKKALDVIKPVVVGHYKGSSSGNVTLFENYVAARKVVASGRGPGGRPGRDVELEPDVEAWVATGKNNVLG